MVKKLVLTICLVSFVAQVSASDAGKSIDFKRELLSQLRDVKGECDDLRSKYDQAERERAAAVEIIEEMHKRQQELSKALEAERERAEAAERASAKAAESARVLEKQKREMIVNSGTYITDISRPQLDPIKGQTAETYEAMERRLDAAIRFLHANGFKP